MSDFFSLVDALPTGTFFRTFERWPYRVTRSLHAAGRSVHLEAQAIARRDCLSFDLYRLANGRRLPRLSEVPSGTVRRFPAISIR